MPILALRSVDDTANIRLLIVALRTVRAGKYGPVRIGPFDDALCAEQGVFIEGAKTTLMKLQPALRDALAAAKPMLPALVERMAVIEEAPLEEKRT